LVGFVGGGSGVGTDCSPVIAGIREEVDEVRREAAMSNVRPACSCSSWNGSGVRLELHRAVAAFGDDVRTEKLRDGEGLRCQETSQREGMKGKARGRA
jgi:hypothetical protein